MANTMAMSGLRLAPVNVRPAKPILDVQSQRWENREFSTHLTVVCKKNHHRSPCNSRICGLNAQDLLLHELEEEVQGLSRFPTTAFPDASEPGSPRGTHGGPRNAIVNMGRNNKIWGAQHSGQFEGDALDNAEGSEGDVEAGSQDKLLLKEHSDTVVTTAQAETCSLRAEAQDQRSKQDHTPEEKALSWQENLRVRMFWLFRTLSTVID